MDVARKDVETSHGVIAVEMTNGTGPDVVFIHGNSSSRRVFHSQFSSEVFAGYRLICFDLPGHGESGDALDKARTYPLPGLAEASEELLDNLGVKAPILVGWSLGGHVAIEMVSHSYPAAGLFIVGAPPVGPVISEGFRGNLLSGLASRGAMTAEDAARFAQNVFGAAVEPFMEEAAARTDQEFRSTLFSGARLQEKSNQRDVVSSTDIWTAVVNGGDDQVVNLDYIDNVPFSRLWRNVCFRLPQAGHAPFLQQSAAFNKLLSEFLSDVAAAGDC